MKKTVWLTASAAILALPFVALGTAILVIDPNDYKPQLAAAVLNATGRVLTLNGPLRISRSLWPTIEVSDVQLANLPGGSRPDMARAERIEAQIALVPLLHRELQINALTLIGPNILFEQVGGKPNWVFDGSDPPTAGGPSTSIDVQAAHVQNGMVTFKLPARTKVVGVRTLDFHHPLANGPLQTDSVLVYSDYAPFRLRAAAQPTGVVTDPWTTQLTFAAYDTVASAKGTMNLAGDYDLQLDMTAPALEALNALLPSMQLPRFHDMTLATHLRNGPDRGDIPVIGTTQLHIGSGDFTAYLPGLTVKAVDIALPREKAAATLKGSIQFSRQAFDVTGSFGVPDHLDGKTAPALDLTATLAGSKAATRIGVKGKLALDTGAYAGLDAAIAVRSPDLAVFQPMVAAKLPALTTIAFDGRVAIPADGGSVSLRGIKLTTQEGDLSGDAKIGLAGGVALTGSLHAGRLDADALLPAFGVSASAGAEHGGHMISDAALPWTVLRGPDIDLAATIGTLMASGQRWDDLDLALRLKDGLLHLALPGVRPALSLTVDAAREPAAITLALHAPAMPLAVIARAAELPGQVTGAVRVEADLTAAGRSLHDVAASLDGPVSATMTGGSLSNAALLKLTSAALEALSITVPAAGETAIHCLGLTGSFSKGIGRFKTIALDTSYLELDGAGQVDLGAETLAFKLHPVAQLAGSHVSVPVVVEGPFRAPQGRLDASGVDKLGLLIDAWFGGDHPQTCARAGLTPAH